ncbi:MAG TPA: peptide permease [Lachnoclostridium sp.]|jgi:peptide/nickel transport system permease protein|uniref:ABC transporter permease n=1 Tax=Lacrimispora sp. TaxID=2719234 RepID=UPI000EC22E50|nr:ABC transporter permease [Lacrimispora sp.]HCD46663.1 peptide permease [Lachnoclostridium sp.]
MAKYILRRILTAIPMVLLITILCFALMHFAPYNAIDAMTTPKMSPETIELIKAKYGYDKPLFIQYLRWLNGILNGNFGYSIVTKQSIAGDLSVRIPNTIKLVLPAYATAYIMAIILGLLAGSHKNKAADKVIDGISSIAIAVPSFWFSMLLIFVLGYKLKLLPIVGMHSVGKESSMVDFLRHFIMPFITLTFTFLPANVKFVRSSTVTQFSEDYVLVQRAFGASRGEIMYKHVCKNVLLPIITRLGMALQLLVTGAIITETVFGWPGVGPYFIKAIQGMDYPIVMIVLVLSSALVIFGNLLSDILYCITDPRIREMG